MMSDLMTLQQVTAFIWAEADMLDHSEYDSWLEMWDPEGLYIIPIDADSTDFANTLNYAYDNHHMRELRVGRLRGGESISTSPPPRTLRTVSRIRVTAEEGNTLTVRCAQHLSEYRRQHTRQYAADITFTLQRKGDDFIIQQKVIRLINSEDTLTGIGYIL